MYSFFFFFSSRRRHTRSLCDWSSDVCSSDLVVDAKAGAVPQQLTQTEFAEGGRPAWSPDGRRIAILLGDDDTNTAYEMSKLTIVPSTPSPGPAVKPVIHMASLDRSISNIAWSENG